MAFYDRYGYGGWAPYVPVAERRRKAQAQAQKMAKKGKPLSPINITGRKIADTFWGIAWCDNLEKYCDFENRMPRGRTYARNGSVIDLQVHDGRITSLVSGSELYKIEIKIDKLPAKEWATLCKSCSKEVASVLDLMRGRLSSAVIERLTDPKTGMFPKSGELKLSCSCPDYARMCKHIAATLYGVGHRLDMAPELFFKLRGVEQMDLVSQALTTQKTEDVIGIHQSSSLDGEDLGTMFGIDLVNSTDPDANSSGATVLENQSVSRRKASPKSIAVTRAKAKSQPKGKPVSKVDAKSTHQPELLKPKSKTKAKVAEKGSGSKQDRSVRANAKPNATKSATTKSIDLGSKSVTAKKPIAKKKAAAKTVNKIGVATAPRKAVGRKPKKSSRTPTALKSGNKAK